MLVSARIARSTLEGGRTMADDTDGARSRRNARSRAGLLAAAVVGTALLGAACGGPHPASPGASPSQQVVQNMAAFAQCMRSHGEPGFSYVSAQIQNQIAQNPPSTALELGPGYVVIGIDTHTAVFASAMKSCQHLDTIPPPPPVSKQKLARDVKAAACIRAHGYPGYPDPVVQDGHEFRVPAPSSIDTSSPQFQTVWNACWAKG
jgi:hypothetical protein